jgi:hypothetical protein
MAIILAIEPDRRQRDTLTSVVRHSVGAELILADTTEHALEAIGNRVPDLVLVPALLSPTDDAALAAALRVIAAAAHVRTLTIPVLAAQSASEAKGGGLFSRWRKGNATQALDGCDPALFAEQIVAYLKESAAERAQLADQEEAARRRAAREKPQATAAAVAPAEPAADVPPDMVAFTEIDETDYPQPEMPAAAHRRTEMPAVDAQAARPPAYAEMQTPSATRDDAFSPRGDETYTRADAEIYTPADAPIPVYTPTYSFGSAQPPSTHADAQPDDTVVSEPATLQDEEPPYEESAYASPDVPSYAHQDYSALLHDELVAYVNGGHFDTQPADAGSVATPEAEQEEDIDLSGELDGLESEDAAGTDAEELFDGEPIGIYTMPSVVEEPEIELRPVPVARNRRRAEPEPAVDPVFFIEPEDQPQVEAVAARAIDARPTEPSDAESEAAETAAHIADAETWKVPTPRSAPALRSVAAPPAAAPAAPAPRVAAASGSKRDRPEWSELVASLRKDIERRRVEPPEEKPKPKRAAAPVRQPAGGTEVPAPVPAAGRRSRKAKPIQDEWGFFDPEQCGFAALLAKLDEITEDAEEPEVRQTR